MLNCTKKKDMTIGHVFLFGFRPPEAASTLRYFKCSGQMNCPCAKVFTCGKTLVRRRRAAPPCGAPFRATSFSSTQGKKHLLSQMLFVLPAVGGLDDRPACLRYGPQPYPSILILIDTSVHSKVAEREPRFPVPLVRSAFPVHQVRQSQPQRCPAAVPAAFPPEWGAQPPPPGPGS